MYYLYRHIRLDKNEVFYIGIGTIPSNNILKQLGRTHKSFYRRAYEKIKSRNPYWKNIINKTDYEIEIVIESNNKEFIIQKEIEFIKLYKNTLCNMTDGGDGIDNYNHTKSTKQQISNTMKGRKLSNSHRININKRKSKKIIIYNQKNKFLFNSITEAALFLGNKNKVANISNCLHGKRNHVSGYKFKFQEITESKDKEL